MLDGTVQRGSKARVTRDGELVFEGSTAAKLFSSNVVYANVPNVEKK